MRIPHYLQKAPTGVWHYRQRVPVCLAAVIGRSMVKRSLLTRELGVARDLALRWWRAYDELHTNTRRLSMAGKTKDVQSLIENELGMTTQREAELTSAAYVTGITEPKPAERGA